MPSGSELRDRFGVGRHLEQRIVRYEEDGPPVPFRGFTDGSEECLPFFEEMEAALTSGSERSWSITAPSGCGKTTLAKAALVTWGKRFLAEPDRFPAVLQVDPPILRKLVENGAALDRALLRASLGHEEAEALSSQGVGHPIICILDKDETAGLESWNVPALPVEQPFRLLHIALVRHNPGHLTRMRGWEGEMALLAAHALGGEEGVARWNALAGSPIAALRTYPLFVSWLLAQPSLPLDAITDGTAILDFLESMHAVPRTSPVVDLPEWCRQLLWGNAGFDPLAARKLYLGPNDWGRAFEGGLIALALDRGRIDDVLRHRLLEPKTLGLITCLCRESPLRTILEKHDTSRHDVLTNLVNLLWKLDRKPIPDRLLGQLFWQAQPPGLLKRAFRTLVGKDAETPKWFSAPREEAFREFRHHLPGYRFAEPVRNMRITFTDLSGSGLEEGAHKSTFLACSLAVARIRGDVTSCSFTRCKLDRADLTGATFRDCRFREVALPRGSLGGEPRFTGCSFYDVTFGATADGSPILFENCMLTDCRLEDIRAAGLLLTRCNLRNVSFERAVARRLEAPGAAFHLCNLEGLRSKDADLSSALFERSILANASLRGANLRSAQLIQVDFQPGPGSRSGLTALPTRSDALHGSKSGFYAQDISDGVYLDPELLRTADLRDADLRGVFLKDTDLFRVDLRGALLDPELRNAAMSMQAFLE